MALVGPDLAGTSVRVKPLDMGGLGAAEIHGKRLDRIGQARKVRDVPALVWDDALGDGMELRARFDAHMEGVRLNKACRRPVLHLLFQWPKHLPVDPDLMLDKSIEFTNRTYSGKASEGTHGGDAVFAARVDRDEKGKHSVDVFAAPRYRKKPDGPLWSSPTRFGKLLAHKHKDEIERRHPDNEFSDSPRFQGMALQSEWANFLMNEDIDFRPKQEKLVLMPDRLPPEEYAAEKIASAEAAEERAEALEADAERRMRAAAKREREAELAAKASALREAESKRRAADAEAKAALQREAAERHIALAIERKAEAEESNREAERIQREAAERDKKSLSRLRRVAEVVRLTEAAIKKPLPGVPGWLREFGVNGPAQ